jgi:hypothetical protein
MANLMVSLILSPYEEAKLVKMAYTQQKSVSQLVTEIMQTAILNSPIMPAP